jgi:hypothetical protein
MHLRLIASFVLLAALVCLPACDKEAAVGGQVASLQQAKSAGWTHFGPSQRLAGTTLAVAEVNEAAEDVVVTGEIAEVCQTKGCWMTVKDGDSEMTVRFKNYSFFVPMDAAGHQAAIHGNVEVTPISVESLQQAAEAAGATPEEIAAITEPGQRVVFMADAVYIEGDDLDEPYKPGDEIDMTGHDHADHAGEHGEGGAMVESGGGCAGEDEGCGNCPDAAANIAANVETAAPAKETEACAGEKGDAGCSGEHGEEACGGCEGADTKQAAEQTEKKEAAGCGGCGGCGGD